jgi:hypothetical protein
MNKTYFSNHNYKALEIVNKYKDIIYSFLDADPSKTKFNHIVTIPVSNRSDNNGWSNFRFDYQEKSHQMDKLNVRVETNTFMNELIIQTSKVNHLIKSDLIVFPGQDNECVYLSFIDKWGNRDWLINKKFYRQETISWNGKDEKTYNYYNLRNLLANGQIIEVLLNKVENKIVVLSNLDFLLPENEVKDTRVWKSFNNYNIDLSHIQQVQFDGKQPNTVFWCTNPSRYTNNIGSTTKISLYLETLSTKDHNAIYQQINRTYKKTIKTGKAFSFKIPAKQEVIENKHFRYDPDMIDEKGNITIYVSNDPSFDVIENKIENVTNDIKAYRKVWKWIKENPNKTNFPKKWTKDDIEIANEIIRKN